MKWIITILWCFLASAAAIPSPVIPVSPPDEVSEDGQKEQQSKRTLLSSSCISPTGIVDGTDSSISSAAITTERVKQMLQDLPFLFLPLADPLIQGLVTTYETPIQFRQAQYHGMSCYNVAAMYHPTALDIWGHEDKRICIEDFLSEDQKNAHEQVATTYAFAYSANSVSPNSVQLINDIMDNILGLPMSNLDGDPDISTPWGLAKSYVDQMSQFAETDGWNADGSLSNNFNTMPFRDFDYEGYSAYKPQEGNSKNESDNHECKKEWSWEPLLETNYVGYFTKQEHVTPFAGFTGRLYGMTTSEYEDFSISKPNYDYCQEADYVLDETRKMADDESKKILIELYDSKFTSLLPMQINWSLKNQVTSFEFWFYDLALVTAMYDATMLVWREKVTIDAVRPTTVIHTLKGESEVDTYAGPYESVKKIKGKDWHPYIRTMPHAEFPSGSSCICTAFAETLQLLTGQDETGDFAVTIEMKAGSSKAEPGVSPQNDVTLTYTKWSEIQHACGESRLYGGMHFSKAIPAGKELCTGVASHVVNRAHKLKLGEVDGAFADLSDASIRVKGRSSCFDSKTWTAMRPNKLDYVDCSWVAMGNTMMKCKRRPGSIQNCPKACGTCGQSGVNVCENEMFSPLTKKACNEVNCCKWDDDNMKCLSDVGTDLCFPE